MGGCVGSHHDSSGSLNENSDGTGGEFWSSVSQKLFKGKRGKEKRKEGGGRDCMLS